VAFSIHGAEGRIAWDDRKYLK